MSDEEFAAGSLPDAHRLILQAINTRLGLLVSLRAFAASDSAATERQRTPLAGPIHFEAINAATIIQIFGYIEGFVEGCGARVVDDIRTMRATEEAHLRARLKARLSQAREHGIPGSTIAAVHDVANVLINRSRLAPPLQRLNKGLPRPERWEDGLRRVGLGAPSSRPIPDDLAANLAELAQVRNVLLHRLGRMDAAAIAAVVEGSWREVGEEARIDDQVYRRYIAALWSYYEEIQDRFAIAFGSQPRSSSLEDWRDRVPAGG
jgi:hypothetical protein